MPPSADEQVKFLVNLQRLLSEGQFVATYKYALLIALADVCIEIGDDSGAPLTIPTTAIAEKFITYYWRHSVPYVSGSGSGVLMQNTGNQAAVIRLLTETRAQYGDSLSTVLQRPGTRSGLVRKVGQVVRVMPLWKLQTVGEERLEFLYPNIDSGDSIDLKHGIAFCFRRFHGLIVDLVRGAWMRTVRQQNSDLIGEAADLSEFLFGSERTALATVRPALLDLQCGRCFYCGGTLQPGVAEVDHFISWSRYPVDLGHNFVLADCRCNSKKRDRLAALEHLQKWTERNEKFGAELGAEFESRGVVHNLGASGRVAYWAYGQTEAANGLTWLHGEDLVPLPPAWRVSLGAFGT